jgi:hypothetical protein
MEGTVPQKQYAVFPMDRLLQKHMLEQQHRLQQVVEESPRTRQVRYEIESTSANDMANLDSKMKEIIIDNELKYPDPDTKVKALKSVLQRFLDVSRSARQPFRFPNEVDEAVLAQESAEEPALGRFDNLDRVAKEIENAAGKAYKNRAKNLVQHLINLPELGWNARGELVIANKLLPGTNIVTLVVDAVKPAARNPTVAPEGWEDFGNLLRRNNVPELYVGNRLRYLQNVPNTFQFEGRGTPEPPSPETVADVALLQRRQLRNRAAAGPASKRPKRNWDFVN